MKVNRSLHYIFWRWHFYAGLFITPLLITLSLSGIGYLFREEVEDFIYKDLYFGKSAQTESISMADSLFLTEKNIHIIVWRKLVSLMGIIIRGLLLQMNILGNKNMCI